MAVPAACCAFTLVLHSPLAPKHVGGGMGDWGDRTEPLHAEGFMAVCGSDYPEWDFSLSGCLCPSPSSGHPLCAALLLSGASRLSAIPLCIPMHDC